MNAFLILVEILSLVFEVKTYNPYSLSRPHDIYHRYQSLYSPLQYQQQSNEFSPRFLYLFNLLNGTASFPSFLRTQSCQSAFAADVHGSCIKLMSCIFRGGKPAGTCNYGLSTCCVAFFGRSKLPVSTFTKNSFTQNPAMFVVKRASPFYCQIRVDFKSFNVGFPDQNGICTLGWNVTGQADTNVPTICGLNDGQHVYLNFDNFTPIKMTINFNETAGDDWAIKVTQIKCKDQENLAPTGCLQYFPEASGQVESFNFQTLTSVPDVTSTQTTYQLANLDYYACIGTQSNTYSQITWTKGVGTTNYYFVMTSNIGLIPSNFVGTIAAAEYNGDCTGAGSPTNDYVEIPNGQFTNINGVPQTETQYCGAGFPPAVTSTTKPFRLHVVTNGLENAFEGSIGFSLSYVLS